jgi:hypothetical protein
MKKTLGVKFQDVSGFCDKMVAINVSTYFSHQMVENFISKLIIIKLYLQKKAERQPRLAVY